MTTANANDHRHTTCKFCSRTQCFIKKCWTSAGHCKCYSAGRHPHEPSRNGLLDRLRKQEGRFDRHIGMQVLRGSCREPS